MCTCLVTKKKFRIMTNYLKSDKDEVIIIVIIIILLTANG